MAINTIYTYPLNGSNREFHIPFEYLARKFVVVTLIGTDRRELTLTEEYRFTTRAHVQTNRVWGPADGYERIEIRRLTSATDRLVDFADGSILRASELNISQVQTLHVAEEARNMVADTIAENSDGDLDARGRRLVNLADATSPDHAVTLRQEMAWAEGALNSRNAAASSQQHARASEIACKDSEAKSKASELAAKDSEARARASELAAASSNVDAEWNRNRAREAAVASEAARDISVTRSQQSYSSAQDSHYWAQQAIAAAAGVGLPASIGPRYLLSQNDAGNGLRYSARLPASLGDSSSDAVMLSGSFGLGGTALGTSAGTSANSLRVTGWYYMNAGVDCPEPSYYGWIEHIEITPGEYSYQVAFDVTGRRWCRALNRSWGIWQPTYNGFNVADTIRALMASTTTQQARAAIGAAEKKTRGYTFEPLWAATSAGLSASNQAVPVYNVGDLRVLSQVVRPGDTLFAGFCNTNAPAHTLMSSPFVVTGIPANVTTDYGPAGAEAITFRYASGNAYMEMSLASDQRSMTLRMGSGGWYVTSIYRGLIEA